MTTSQPPVIDAHLAFRQNSRDPEPYIALADWIQNASAQYGTLFISDNFRLPLDQKSGPCGPKGCMTEAEKIEEIEMLLREHAVGDGIFGNSERDYLRRVLRTWVERLSIRDG